MTRTGPLIVTPAALVGVLLGVRLSSAVVRMIQP
jgi:hypothetical protein